MEIPNKITVRKYIDTKDGSAFKIDQIKYL